LLRRLAGEGKGEAREQGEGEGKEKGKGKGKGEEGELGEKTLPAFEILGETTLHIIVEISLGKQREGLVAEMARAYREGMASLEPYFLAFLLFGPVAEHLPLPGNLRARRSALRKILLPILERKQVSREPGQQDFISLLISSGELSAEEIMDEITSLFFAGHDTTSSLLSWSFYFLCRYPEEQTLLREELERGSFDLEKTELEELEEKFPRLKMFLLETLRMRPPIMTISRYLGSPETFQGHTLPKGTIVNLMIMAAHHDPAFWEEPERFWPDRFDPKRDNSPERDPFSFLPFSGGPRSCLGRRFAMIQAQIILASVVSRFHLSSHQREVFIDGSGISKPADFRVSFSLLP